MNIHHHIRVFGLVMCLLFLITGISKAQNRAKSDRLLDKARAAYLSRDWKNAIEPARKALQDDPDLLEGHLLLAEIYKELDSVRLEISSLQQAARLTNSRPLIFLRLGDALLKVADYQGAIEAYNRCLAGNIAEERKPAVVQKIAGCRFALQAVQHPVQFSPVNLGSAVNSVHDDYWPSLTVDGRSLVFTRLMPAVVGTTFPQEDFYLSSNDGSGWQPAQPVVDLNTPQNEGAQTISADGRLLFFTACNRADGAGSCDIYFSRFENGSWTAPRNAGPPVNTAAWDGQPSLSAFGDVLYFSSSRAGGKGKKDLWKADLKGWSPGGLPVWDEAVNLGDSINTPGEEISPFIHPNGVDLFFSSDYWPGMGGFDLFRSRLLPSGATQAQNLGYPINSAGNEQGLVVDRTGQTAYLSSNREPQRGMDIYSFELDERLRPDPVTFVKGKVVNARTRQPVQAVVQITGLEAGTSCHHALQADVAGAFNVVLPLGTALAFQVSEPGFLFYSENFSFKEKVSASEPLTRDIELVPVEVGSQTNLYNIFFETDSFHLLPASFPELGTLVSFLEQNPSLQVEIQGHTDNSGSAEYNLALSEKRAHSVLQYLVEKGIAPGRLAAKGLGMSQPVASNETPDGKAKNRRTTIKITGVR